MPCPRHGKGPGGCLRFRWEGSGGERFLGEINSPGPPMTQGRRRRSCCVFPSARGGKVPAVLWKSAAFCGSSAVPMPFRGKNAPGAVPCRKGRVRKGLPYRMAAGCGMFRLAAFGRRPPCERVLRTRSRRPTPSRRCRAVVSKEGMKRAGERCARALALFRPCSGTAFARRSVRPSFAKGKALFNAPFGSCLQCSGFSARCCSAPAREEVTFSRRSVRLLLTKMQKVFTASFCSCLHRNDLFSALRGFRARSGGRAGGCRPLQCTCGVKRKAPRAGLRSVQRVRADGPSFHPGEGVPGKKKARGNSPRPGLMHEGSPAGRLTSPRGCRRISSARCCRCGRRAWGSRNPH